MYSILVADDEKDVVSLLKDYLELKGYCVYTANNGKEAIEQASRTPDLILLDVNMPEADGFEVCRRIRDHVSCPILFLTARIEDEDKIQGFAAGGDDYIIKPFSLEEIGARIAAHIRRDHRVNTANNVRFFGDVVVYYSNKTVSVREEALDLASCIINDFRSLKRLSVTSSAGIEAVIAGGIIHRLYNRSRLRKRCSGVVKVNHISPRSPLPSTRIPLSLSSFSALSVSPGT